MNAPEHLTPEVQHVLDTLAICYAPLIDKKRKAIGTRLTLLSARPQDRRPMGELLTALNDVWPLNTRPLMLAPLDAPLDGSVEDWDAPRNAVLEVPAAALRDPEAQAVVQRLFRDGKHLALRGRPDAPLPPVLLSCFESALIHISEDRRVAADGKPIAATAQIAAQRRMPFVITGVQTVADVDSAFERGAVCSVGWPMDDGQHRRTRPLQPGQAVVLELLRLVRDDAALSKIDAALKRDPALAFRLLRLVNSAAFGLTVQITSFQHAVMMLGYKKMMRWLSLLLATASDDANTFPLMHASIRRGMFLEIVGGEGQGTEVRDELFITGAFSMLDRITGAPFDQLFNLISLSSAVVDAVERRDGPYGAYLTLIESIERSDPIGLVRQLDALAMPVETCNRALLKAMQQADLLDGDL